MAQKETDGPGCDDFARFQEAQAEIKARVTDLITRNFAPRGEGEPAHYSTQEIYDKLQRFFCNTEMFSAADINAWLHEAGYNTGMYGHLNFEWQVWDIQAIPGASL